MMKILIAEFVILANQSLEHCWDLFCIWSDTCEILFFPLRTETWGRNI